MELFDIVILGFDRSRPDSPAAGLQRVFPIDQGTAVRLINALPATVKRRVPQTAAEQYQAALIAIGARVELRPAAPAPAPAPPAPSKAPSAPTVPAAGLGVSRFAGGATVKDGSPSFVVPVGTKTRSDAPPPPSRPISTGPSAVEASDSMRPLAGSNPPPSFGVAHAQTEAPPPPQEPVESWGNLRAPLPSAAPAAKSGGAKEAGFADTAVPKVPALPVTPSAVYKAEREENRKELFRRLLDPAGAEPAAEDVGGISLLDLDLPPPRPGWSSPESETLGAEEVRAPSLETLQESGRPPAAAITEAAGSPSAAAPASARPVASLPAAAPASAPDAGIRSFHPPRAARSFNEVMVEAMAMSLRDGGGQWVLVLGGVGLLGAIVLSLLPAGTTSALVGWLLIAILLFAIGSEQAVWTLRAGLDELDSPDPPDLRASDVGRYFSAGFNLLCFVALTQAPFLMWLSRHREQLPGALTQQPLGLLWLIVGAALWPGGMALQAHSENPLAVWSLLRILRFINLAPVEYVTVCLVGAITVMIPLGVSLLGVRMGLPAASVCFGISVGFALSQAVVGALMGHVARLYPRAFED